MFNVFVIDKDVRFSEEIESTLKEFSETTSTFNIRKLHIQNDSFTQFVKTLTNVSSKYNIYLIDINLGPSMNGFTLAKEIRKFDFEGYIIIITSHIELVGSSYSYHLKALNFIDKANPYFNSQLIGSLERILYETNKSISLEKFNENINYLTFNYKKRKHKITVEDIVFIETHLLKRCLLIHTTSDVLEYGGTLTSIMEELPDYFYRCHKSYILNRKYIKKIELELPNFRAFFNNNMSCTISKKYIEKPFDLMVN